MKKWLITAAVLLIVGLIGVGVTTWMEGDLKLDRLSTEINQVQSVAADGVQEIVVSTDSIEVTAVKGTTNEIVATLSGKLSNNYVDATKLNVVREEDKVLISVDTVNWNFGLSIFDVEIKVELPEQYRTLEFKSGSGDMELANVNADNVLIESQSGEVNLKGVTAQELRLKTGSGDMDSFNLIADTVFIETQSGEVHLEDVTAQELQVKTGSGDMELANWNADTVFIETQSGEAKLDGVAAQALKLKSGSGDISLTNVNAELELETQSGYVGVKATDLTMPIRIATGSGDVSIKTNERPSAASIKFRSGSGDWSNKWNGNEQSDLGTEGQTIVFGDGSVPVDIITGSGDLTIGKR